MSQSGGNYGTPSWSPTPYVSYITNKGKQKPKNTILSYNDTCIHIWGSRKICDFIRLFSKCCLPPPLLPPPSSLGQLWHCSPENGRSLFKSPSIDHKAFEVETLDCDTKTQFFCNYLSICMFSISEVHVKNKDTVNFWKNKLLKRKLQ